MLKDPSSPLSKRSIFYELDQFDVKDEFRGLVEAHAKYLRENPSAHMMIQGNTDERGSREYNVALGQRRSDGVKKMLVLLGARENQIESVSLGEEKPQADRPRRERMVQEPAQRHPVQRRILMRRLALFVPLAAPRRAPARAQAVRRQRGAPARRAAAPAARSVQEVESTNA